MTDLNWIRVCGEAVIGRGPLPLALFFAGIGGSVTHCVTMCSVFVLGQAPAVADKGVVARLLLPYHAGRITTYVLLGALAGFGLHLVSGWSGFGIVRRLLLAAVAMIFLTTLAGRLLARAGLRLPFSLGASVGCMIRDLGQLRRITSGLRRYGLGLMLGFLPCPLVLAALAAASSSARWDTGAVAMLAFGVGTLPALLGLAFTSSNLLRKSPRLQDGLTLAALGINGVILIGLAAG